MNEVLFHHYPQSPVAEKVRVAFGIKALSWRSVQIPRIPPKPDLMPLTGGYRRTPVMQIGAEVYCDSQCILRELERRFAQPSLFPPGARGGRIGVSPGVTWGVNAWTDGAMFTDAVAVVLGGALDDMPEDFAADRGRLYFGAEFDLHAQRADGPHKLAQLRAQLGWIDDALHDGRAFIGGDAAGLADAQVYYIVWFLRGRFPGGPGLLAQFQHLCEWEQRVHGIGHGTSEPLDALDALSIAREASIETVHASDAHDPQGLEPGMAVAVQPLGDGGDPVVVGELLAVTRDEVVVLHENERVRQVAIHFPRVGYRVDSRAGSRADSSC